MAPKPNSSSTPIAPKDRCLTRRQVEGLIADGNTIIIVDSKVLKLDAWLQHHPGGEKTLMHVVGRDATDEVNAYGNPLAVSILS